MKLIVFISTFILFNSCTPDSDKKAARLSSTVFNTQKEQVAVDNALKFINLYVINCNKMKEAVGVVEWVKSNELTSKRFKSELELKIKEGYKIDPEIGIGADPIFDAQEFPDKGFELESFDNKTNLIVVKGKDWADFKLTMKMVLENGHWLIDGCGMINMTH